jgi:hypothetical protein
MSAPPSMHVVELGRWRLYLIDSRSLIPICREHDISARVLGLGLGTSPSTLAVPRVASPGNPRHATAR